jgi:3-hydroxyisobutyrate dehydrogenase-like beta-hydroxyacid dehydrogenase
MQELNKEIDIMSLNTIGILSPGDMGHIVGRVLGSYGLNVITCLQGRRKRTRALAARADIADVPTYQALVCDADIILSILPPAQAEHAAQKVAHALAETNTDLIYADCNAISPETVCRIGEIITSAGGRFVDASIIGPPPRNKGSTRFYASGPHVNTFETLNQFGLEVRSLGEEIGLASAIKMCYASLTKGLTALCTELLTAAEVMGVLEALKTELQMSQSALFERMERIVPMMPPKSQRWIGEMEEISATFAHVGLTPKILAGAADIYRFVDETLPVNPVPEDRNSYFNLIEIIQILANPLKKNNLI